MASKTVTRSIRLNMEEDIDVDSKDIKTERETDRECKTRLATCMKCKNVAHFAKGCKKREKDTSRR